MSGKLHEGGLVDSGLYSDRKFCSTHIARPWGLMPCRFWEGHAGECSPIGGEGIGVRLMSKEEIERHRNARIVQSGGPSPAPKDEP